MRSFCIILLKSFFIATSFWIVPLTVYHLQKLCFAVCCQLFKVLTRSNVMITMKVCSSSLRSTFKLFCVPFFITVCFLLSGSYLKADHSTAASPASGHPKGWFSLQMADLAVSGLSHLQHCQT